MYRTHSLRNHQKTNTARRRFAGVGIAFSAIVGTPVSAQQIYENNKLVASDAATGDQFDYSAAISGTTAMVGAYQDDNKGSAYLFNTATPCPADLTGEGDLNFLDVSAYLAAFGAGDLAADFTGEGDFNFLDVSAFLAEFAAGCS